MKVSLTTGVLEMTSSIQATSVNCAPIRPSFKKNEKNVELMRDVADLVKDTKDIKNVDEDTMQRLKGIVENIEINPDSKIQKPLKTLALSLITLATGTLLSSGTACKGFYMVKDKKIVQDLFAKLGKKMVSSTDVLQQKALQEGISKTKKYFYQASNYLLGQLNNYAEKGVKAGKDSAEFLTQKAENLTKKAVQTIGGAVGLTTSGAALAVDNDGNGKSDILEFKEKKNEQKAVLELASAVLDAM